MLRKRLAIAVSLVSAVSVAQAEVFDARAMGRGGVGLTMGEYNQATVNPALINQFDDNDQFSFALNFGVIASDAEGLLGDLDDIGDTFDALEACSGSCGGSEAARANNALEGANGKVVAVGVGAGVMVGVPNKLLPAAVTMRGGAELGITTNYKSSDQAVLNGVAAGTNDLGDLTSTVETSGLAVSELGLTMGHTWEGYQLGAMLKIQQINLVSYEANPDDFEASDALDEEDYYKEHSGMNIDLGMRKTFGDKEQFVYAATIENLIPQSYDGPAGEYKMNPVPVAAIGYQSGWLKAEASMDLAQRSGYGLLGDRQFTRIGAEFSAGKHAHLRAGYAVDMKDTVSNMLSVGFGLTPWDRANIDLAAQLGEGDTYAVALQLGFKI
ncbi:MAG: conjugal transfer protein TraF [Alcanivoracaceae bacterium]|nr:conjugal transfer protein TraF [Alcanivoracaceae bacterium]